MAFARAKKREPVGEAGLFEYAIATLARGMRTERELRRLMQNRAEPGEAGGAAMDRVVARLVELKYLSDSRFAADYTRLRQENEKFGRRRVEQGLMQKGVAKETVATALGEAYDGLDEVELARAYCARKRMKAPEGTDPMEKKKAAVRVMNRLLRAGFSPGAIFKLLRRWDVPIEDVEEALPED